MSALHLLWIIPLSASFGAFTMALFVGASRADKHIYMSEDKEEKICQ